jgi:hypothetical protein
VIAFGAYLGGVFILGSYFYVVVWKDPERVSEVKLSQESSSPSQIKKYLLMDVQIGYADLTCLSKSDPES